MSTQPSPYLSVLCVAVVAGGLAQLVSAADPARAGGAPGAKLDAGPPVAIVPLEERDAQRAATQYRSPRLLRLWKELRADGAAAVDRFAREMDGHAPLVEPRAEDPGGDMLVTFVTRARPGTRYVGLFGGPKPDLESGLLRFEETDLFYLTLRVPRDARFTYQLRPGDPPNAGATQKEMAAAFATVQLDAWNPRVEIDCSYVELPSAPPQTFTRHVDGVPEGRLVTRTIHSTILGEDRRVSVYLPAAFDPAGGPYPYVVLFDGEWHGTEPEVPIPTPTILDNLIAQKKVPPMLAVLVHHGGTRQRDLGMSAPFSDFLALELSPWVRDAYPATADPARVTLAGASLGGLSAAYCAFHHPEVFGNALSLSGSFWYAPGAREDGAMYRVETGGMMREILAAPRQPVRFWMEVGLFEGGGNLAGANQVAQNRHMRDLLIAKGYDVSYREVAGNHDTTIWRGSLSDGLIALAGSGAGRAGPP